MKPNQKRIDRGLWWDKAWSLVEGCAPVSPACRQCWSAEATAMRVNQENAKIQQQYSGLIVPGSRPPKFNGKIRLMWDDISKVTPKQKSAVYSVWNDLFHKDVPWNFQYKALERMMICKQHFFIVCTKRPELMAKPMANIWFHLKRNYSLANPDVFVPLEPLKNVMAMTTAENQEQADKRIPHLLRADFAWRGLSAEPMLGPVSIRHPAARGRGFRSGDWINKIDFVACGPETGPKARECKPEWIKSLYEQCQAAGVAFFDKSKTGWLAREFPNLTL